MSSMNWKKRRISCGDPEAYANQYNYGTVSTDPEAVSIENGISSGRYYVYLLSAVDIAQPQQLPEFRRHLCG